MKIGAGLVIPRRLRIFPLGRRVRGVPWGWKGAVPTVLGMVSQAGKPGRGPENLRNRSENIRY